MPIGIMTLYKNLAPSFAEGHPINRHMNSNEKPKINTNSWKFQFLSALDKNHDYESVTYRMEHWRGAKSSIPS